MYWAPYMSYPACDIWEAGYTIAKLVDWYEELSKKHPCDVDECIVGPGALHYVSFKPLFSSIAHS